MKNETNPAGVVWGLAMLAKKDGRLSKTPVRGISEIGANIEKGSTESSS